MEQFETGAKRSERQRVHFHLIPTAPLRRLGRRYALGSGNYGEYNWLKGFPFSDLFNHIQDHLENVKLRYEAAVLAFQGDEEAIRRELKSVLSDLYDDDLAGAAWGIFALMELARTGRITQDEGWRISKNETASAPVDPTLARLREVEHANLELQRLLFVKNQAKRRRPRRSRR